ncbi:MAG: carboxypeptidase-like regulatory domain-containing protein [Planctomycetaceae bacterium]|nr:carboxypeptidase-like regulatory domain-containing protein [Planctomycetaceae bacterium]
MKKIFFIGIFVLVVSVFSGCGRTPIKTDYVEGVVTYNGSPVPDATICFSPIEKGQGAPAYGITDQQGKYKIQTFLGTPNRGTTPGEYIVLVTKVETYGTGKKAKLEDGTEYEITDSRGLLPPVYSSTRFSPLRANVIAGEQNKFDFELHDAEK